MKITGMKLDIDLKNKLQYLIGAAIAFVLSVFIAVDFCSFWFFVGRKTCRFFMVRQHS